MIGKIKVRSYSAKSSRQSVRKCPTCRQKRKAEIVDYGAGGTMAFLECGSAFDDKDRNANGCQAKGVT